MISYNIENADYSINKRIDKLLNISKDFKYYFIISLLILPFCNNYFSFNNFNPKNT